ncbi:MAG TPA: PAS domain S-box protein, partial [Ktedonobacterales bacterium]
MRHVTDALPDGVVVVDNSGRIQLANRQSELMFGYETVDIVGQPVETLMPERFREAHPLHRLSYTQSPHMRPMGTGLRLFGRRKDGSEFPVEISLSPISFAGEPLTLAAIRDVTEQRLMEQRARQAV